MALLRANASSETITTLSALAKALSSPGGALTLNDKTINADKVSGSDKLQFKRYLDLRNVTFTGDLELPGAHFFHGASFIDVTFKGTVNLSSCIFEDHAYFWKCRFEKAANFATLQTTCAQEKNTVRHPGEANFSYCVFEDDADFARSTVSGPFYLHRPVFKKKFIFEGSVLKDLLVLEGAPHDVCCAWTDLPPNSKAALLAYDLVVKCRDHEPYCNVQLQLSRLKGKTEENRHQEVVDKIFEMIRSKSMRPDKPKVAEPCHADVHALAHLWLQQFRWPTLSDEHETDFTGLRLARESPIRHVSLRCCRLERAEVHNIDFVSVAWPYESYVRFPGTALRILDKLTINNRFSGRYLADLFRPWSKRLWHLHNRSFCRTAVFDEKRLDERNDNDIRHTRRDLSNLYHRLMERHEDKGDRESARDFYYGEMEMLRLSKSRLGAIFSLSSIYKLSSGYSKLEGRALGWLLFFVFAFFPAFYGVNNAWFDPSFRDLTPFSEYKRSLLSSLEASTFLTPAPAAAPTAQTPPQPQPAAAAASTPVEKGKKPARPAVAGPRKPYPLPESSLDLITAALLKTTEYLTPPAAAEPERLELWHRGIGAVERLLVAFQAALFLIALKSRFKGPAN